MKVNLEIAQNGDRFILAHTNGAEEISIMSEFERATISFTKAQYDEAQAAIATGRYASLSEIVRHALRLWERTEKSALEAIDLQHAPAEVWRDLRTTGELLKKGGYKGPKT